MMKFLDVCTGILYTFQHYINLCENLPLQRLVFVIIHDFNIHADKKMLDSHYAINRKGIV